MIFEIMWFYHLYFFVKYMTAMIESIEATKNRTVRAVRSPDCIFVFAYITITKKMSCHTRMVSMM